MFPTMKRIRFPVKLLYPITVYNSGHSLSFTVIILSPPPRMPNNFTSNLLDRVQRGMKGSIYKTVKPACVSQTEKKPDFHFSSLKLGVWVAYY